MISGEVIKNIVGVIVIVVIVIQGFKVTSAKKTDSNEHKDLSTKKKE